MKNNFPHLAQFLLFVLLNSMLVAHCQETKVLSETPLIQSDPGKIINVKAIHEAVKPTLFKEYRPTIVDSLEEKKIIIASPPEPQKRIEITVSEDGQNSQSDSTQTNNEASTPTQAVADAPVPSHLESFKERPNMYTTVITPKETHIQRETYTNNGFGSSRIVANKQSTQNNLKRRAVPKSSESVENVKLQPGQYTLGVTINNDLEVNDPTKKLAYVNPEFKRSKTNISQIKKSNHADKKLPTPQVEIGKFFEYAFKKIAEEDLNAIEKSLKNQTEKDKISHLLSVREGINKEATNLLKFLKIKIDKTKDIDEISNRMQKLMNDYENQINSIDS